MKFEDYLIIIIGLMIPILEYAYHKYNEYWHRKEEFYSIVMVKATWMRAYRGLPLRKIPTLHLYWATARSSLIAKVNKKLYSWMSNKQYVRSTESFTLAIF